MLLRFLRSLWGAGLFCAALQGCAVTDSVDHRADIMNDSVTRFRNQVILRNIVRSAHDEPLNFASLNSIVGHNTVQLSLPGVPGFTWGTPATGTAGNIAHIIPGLEFLRSTNSQTTESYNFSSDFNFNVPDDPTTYAALLTPFDAATIAFFVQNSLYASDLLYILLINKIRIADSSGRILGEFYSQNIVSRGQDGYDLAAYKKIAYKGLLFNAERGSIAGQKQIRPAAQVCFDSRAYTLDRQKPQIKRTWRQLAQAADAHPAGQLPAPSIKTKATFCDDKNTWTRASASSGGAGAGTNTACVYNYTAGPPGTQPKPCAKDQQPMAPNAATYLVYDKDEEIWIEIYTRSTWGIYQILGTWTNDIEKPGTKPVIVDKYPLYNIRREGDDCFAQVDDKGHYCVPNGDESKNTRIMFILLYQLAGLQTQPVSAQPPSTLRVTP
ncbi:MAG: hypothetical protein ACLP7P_10400 [Rhodomicrobium sp.]